MKQERGRTSTPSQPFLVRLAGPDDAAALPALQHRLDLQTSSMLLEPQERGSSPAALRDRLAAQTHVGSFDLLAVAQGELLGWSAVEVLPYRRAAGTGYVVIGVDAVASGRGVGSALLTAPGSRLRPVGSTAWSSPS